MGKERSYKSGLRKKLVFFITLLAMVTYSTSALFIYFIKPTFAPEMNELLFTSMTLGMGVFWSGVLAFFAAGFIVKPLQRLEQAALKAAEGDIAVEVEVPKSDADIRSLALAFNRMLHNLRDMVSSIDENFTKTNSNVIELSKASESASIQADSISKTISEISAGAESSAMAIQTTAESVEDVIRIAQEVQNHSKSSEQMSKHMVTELQGSKEVIHSLVEGISRLARGNEDSLDAVRRLEDNAKKVEQIIQLVGDIANQTNLLALNASIEAARAGESGRGFAVVADEVRMLAVRTQESTKEIQVIIEELQTQSGQANESMHSSLAMLEDNQALATKVSGSLSDISNAIADLNSINTQVATASEEQKQVTADINTNLSTIYELVSQNVTGITQSAAAAHELSGLSERQKQALNYFKV